MIIGIICRGHSTGRICRKKIKRNKPKMQLGGTSTLQFVKIDFLSIFFIDDFNRIENFLGYLKQHFFININ